MGFSAPFVPPYDENMAVNHEPCSWEHRNREERNCSPNNRLRGSFVLPVSARRENSVYVAVKNLLNFARIPTRVF